MISLVKYNPNIYIKLNTGIYIFDNESATGKTRLCKELRKNQAYGESVASYSYNDYLLRTPISAVLTPNKFDVIMLDRYDMYNGVGSDLIKECATNSIILIDCKAPLKVSAMCDICFISMSSDRIEVSE